MICFSRRKKETKTQLLVMNPLHQVNMKIYKSGVFFKKYFNVVQKTAISPDYSSPFIGLGLGLGLDSSARCILPVHSSSQEKMTRYLGSIFFPTEQNFCLILPPFCIDKMGTYQKENLKFPLIISFVQS